MSVVTDREDRDDVADDLAAKGSVVGVHIPPDGGGERPPGPLAAIMFRIRAARDSTDVRLAARMILGAALVIGAAMTAGVAIRVFLATSGFRAW